MIFCDRETVRQTFAGKSVVIVGSGPGALENEPGFIDSHDVVCRVNNYKTAADEPDHKGLGYRTDVHYSFFGGSIKKSVEDLKRDGVRLCMCKCPNASMDKALNSEWHRKNNKMLGVDYRYIYKNRASWWFCDTYVPTAEEFMTSFELLGRHIPSTGFSALLAVMQFEPTSIYLTGFDFFASRIHNVNESWRPGNPDDPIGHAPEREREWLAKHLDRVTMDPTLSKIMEAHAVLDG